MLLKKRFIFIIIIFMMLFNNLTTTAFEYDTSSLREEVTDVSIHMFLEEGYYHLVIDNTGYVSGEYEREDTVVELEIFAIDGEPEYTADTKNLKAQYYWDIPISTDTFLFFTIHFVFNITATNPVTIFLTDKQGFADFEEEINDFEFRQPVSAFLIIGIIIGAFVLAGIVAGFIEKMRKDKGHVKPVKNGIQVKKEEEKINLGKTKTVIYICENCETEYVNRRKTCSSCGGKLNKVSGELEEI